MSKAKEAWELIRSDGRFALATDDQLTFIVLAAVQHVLSERGEHQSAAQVCEVVQRLAARCEPAIPSHVKRNKQEACEQAEIVDVYGDNYQVRFDWRVLQKV